MRLLLIAASALAMTGCAADAQRTADVEARKVRELAAAIEGRIAGEPTDCISVQRTGGPQIVAPDTLIFRDGGTLFVTQAEGCPFIDANDYVISRVFSGRLCRNDLFQPAQRGPSPIAGPVCRYGQFTPYRRQTD
ncbi:hypothetical protein [Sphingomonas sp.]|uniref:hypothetical protein n=1 Tax=Sphingomonas sp. TaxID=28214 RepID=UPI002C6B035F|nr:hypothetical protein [Sphingomonas sp.]HTG38096.1 hypothetical protein [Sphingomonas sp.]